MTLRQILDRSVCTAEEIQKAHADLSETKKLEGPCADLLITIIERDIATCEAHQTAKEAILALLPEETLDSPPPQGALVPLAEMFMAKSVLCERL